MPAGSIRPDDPHVHRMRAQCLVVMPLDLDFGYLVAVSGAALPSVIIFRLGTETAEVVTQRLEVTLECCEENLLSGAIVTADDDTIRVRQLPITRD